MIDVKPFQTEYDGADSYLVLCAGTAANLQGLVTSAL